MFDFSSKSYTDKNTGATSASAFSSCAEKNSVHIAGAVLRAVPAFILSLILVLVRADVIVGVVLSIIIMEIIIKNKSMQSCFLRS